MPPVLPFAGNLTLPPYISYEKRNLSNTVDCPFTIANSFSDTKGVSINLPTGLVLGSLLLLDGVNMILALLGEPQYGGAMRYLADG